MKKIAIALILAALALTGCATRDGLVPAMVDGQLTGCIEWAQAHGDAELEALCRAGEPLPAVLDLFLARQTRGDAGAE